MTFSYDIFLSHNKADKDRIRQLAERLRDEGFRVWFDEWVIMPGDDIFLAIEHGLEATRVLVLCLSETALTSDWVKLERSTVLFRDPTNAKRRFIPLLIDDCELPDALRRYKYVDLRQSTDIAFKQLMTACHESKTIGTDELLSALTSDALTSFKYSVNQHETVFITKPSWVWFSTPDSFASSKVSILAIIETILASMIYLLIAFKYGTAHLTIAVLLAPILLLRTDESVKYALEHCRSYEKAVIKDTIIPTLKKQTTYVFGLLLGIPFAIILIFVFICIIGIFIPNTNISMNTNHSLTGLPDIGSILLFSSFAGLFIGLHTYSKGLIIRAFSTIRFIFINPYKSISSIPKNWWNQIVCLDTMHPPEIIPGIIEYETTKNFASKFQPFCYLYAASILDTTFDNVFSSTPIFYKLI